MVSRIVLYSYLDFVYLHCTMYNVFQKSQCKRPFIVIMTDVSVCQTEGFQAVWRFLCPFRNLQIMTH
jgi:hypothetical protein